MLPLAAASDNNIIRRRLGGSSGERKLDGAQQSSSSTTSIKFSKCVDIKTLPNNYAVDDDTTLSNIKNKDTLSVKSYVLFYMCSGDTCYEDEEYIVDINTFTKNIASYHANYEETICQVCNKYANYCSSGNDDGGNSYSNNYSNNNSSNNNNYYGGRKLKNFDCDECDQYSCFSQYNNNGYNEEINNLIDDISDCLRTGSYGSNGEELYAGPMCSASGNGVEVALFLDNECTTYTTQNKFSSLPSYYMYGSSDVFDATKDSFQKAFSETTSCEDLDFENPYNQANNYGANYGGNGEMNDYCKQLFNEGGALGLSSCSSNGSYYNGNQNQNNGNNYGNSYGNSYSNDDFLSWYTYDMTVENAQDIEQVCPVVSGMGGSYSNYYNKYKSGTWSSSEGSTSNQGFVMGDVKESSVAIGFISFFFLVGAVAGGVLLYKREQKRVANSKREPLNKNEKGVMT